jgi:hypothetical protein
VTGRVEVERAPSWAASVPGPDIATAGTVDRRAARVLAEAQADRVRLLAEAEASRELEQQRAARVAADARAARERDEWRRATREAERERHAASRRARAEARAAAAHARSVRLARAGRAAGARVGLVPAVAVIVSSAAVACWGQYVYARDVMGLGVLGAVAVPVMIEGATWAVAWLAHQAVARARPSGVLRGATWALAGLAAGLNGWHGTASGGTAVGVSLALASLMGPAMWELLLAGTRDRVEGRTAGRVRAELVRWVRWPVTSWHATTTAAARGCTPTEAWAAAWLDRHGVEVHADARARWLARRVRAQQRRDDADAVRAGLWRLEAGRLVRHDHPLPSRGSDRHRTRQRPGGPARHPSASPSASSPSGAVGVSAPMRTRAASSRGTDTARRLVEARAADSAATHADLAQRLGVSERTVRRHLSAARLTQPPTDQTIRQAVPESSHEPTREPASLPATTSPEEASRHD